MSLFKGNMRLEHALLFLLFLFVRTLKQRPKLKGQFKSLFFFCSFHFKYQIFGVENKAKKNVTL